MKKQMFVGVKPGSPSHRQAVAIVKEALAPDLFRTAARPVRIRPRPGYLVRPRIIAKLGRRAYVIGFRGALGEAKMLGILDWLRRTRRVRATQIYLSIENAREFLASVSATERRSYHTASPEPSQQYETMMLMKPGVQAFLKPVAFLERGRMIVEVRA